MQVNLEIGIFSHSTTFEASWDGVGWKPPFPNQGGYFSWLVKYVQIQLDEMKDVSEDGCIELPC